MIVDEHQNLGTEVLEEVETSKYTTLTINQLTGADLRNGRIQYISIKCIFFELISKFSGAYSIILTDKIELKFSFRNVPLVVTAL